MPFTSPLSRRATLTGVVTAAAALPILSACTSGASSSDGTTLTVMAGAQDLSKEQIAEFEAQNAGVKINVINTDPTRLSTMLGSGNPPDIATGPAVGSANFNARGLATDLTPYLDKSAVLKEADLQPVNDSFRWDGTSSGQGPLYGIVKDWSQDASLWYNTALFDQAGIPYLSETEPITYDQLLEIAKKLTLKDGATTTVYGLGMEWAWGLYGPIATMIHQQGGELYNGDLTEIDLTSPAAVKAFTWFVDFANAGVGPTSLNPLADASDYSTFAAGRMAITQDGYWFGGNFAAPDSLQTARMAPAPVMGETRANPTFSGQGWWIPEKAKNKDLAWKLMEYFMAGPPAQARAESGWGLQSLTPLLTELPQETPLQQNAYAVAQNELQYAFALPDSPYITNEFLISTLDKYVVRAIKQELTIEAACAGATDEINKALAQGKEQIG
ncbi:ABC transporter substrate-binding protein [Kineococcus radiotolerans]|uniref:Extracellular solute-binding protein family 1 n=1 Tax=Kineococcus radiotolerans (strain ATCC BAA-149 / DSM 14245 / SRS30216) TaxID=266940 RepID=A6WB31_KINRD|nr:sugar ABC transporter substrate-binding protein [Kineococcus radiotolerans]ABS04020.1 extracellular solute-binding protein family 1 [Kineococcus radiotolerans SRS30216 = ATCC BAA-149]